MSAHVSRNNQGPQPKSDDYMYDLMAVSNHYGNMMGGHYTAYCRNPIDGKWREYDDAKVETLGGSVVTKEAYLLFYQRRSLSKTVNQRLFNGDHWIYSLSLSPSEKITENSENSPTNLGSELTQQVWNSRSRSASPSTLRQSNRGKGTHLITTSMTPQPVRRPMVPFVDDKELSDGPSFERSSLRKSSNASRRSRSLQRQSSGSRSRVRREGSLENSVGSIDRSHNNRSSPNIEMRDSDMVSSFRPKLSNDVARQQTHPSRSTGVGRPPPAVDGKRDSTTSKDISISTPKHVNHDLPQNKTRDIHTSPSSITSDILQEKQDNKNTSQSSGSPRDSPTFSHEENPSRKLASIMKQGIINRANTHATKTDNVDNSVKNGFTKHQTVTKVDSQDSFDSTAVSQASTSNNGHHVHNSGSDTINTDNGFNPHQHINSPKSEYTSTRHSHPTKDTDADPNVRQYVDSEFKQKLNDLIGSYQFHKPLQKHVDGTNGQPAPSNGRHTSRFADDIGILDSGELLCC